MSSKVIRPLNSQRQSRPARAGLLALTTVLVVAVAGCGTGSAGDGAASDALPDGGWIDGAPPSRDGGASDDSLSVDSHAEDMAPESSTMPAPEETETPSASSPPSRSSSPLRAGNIDDNADFAGFLDYLSRVEELGIPYRRLDPTGRVMVTVKSGAGDPIAGAEVVVRADGEEVTKLRTTADGTTRFHPVAYDVADASLSIAVGDVSQDTQAGGEVTLVTGSTETPSVVPLDIAFAIDTTGSMGDELDRLKDSVTSVVDRIEELPGSPDVRLAMTAYRDEGDEYVTATHDFTGDVGEFREALAGLEADGGGDTPEALDEAVAEALTVPQWRDPSEATQLLFVISDAGGHPDRAVDEPYTESMKQAAERGIKIVPIAASSTDDQAEVAFRQLAQFTGGRFVFLAYGVDGAAVGGSTDIASTDYEELSLDDLIVRLVADELFARTGVDEPVPTTGTTVPTTHPPGQ